MPSPVPRPAGVAVLAALEIVGGFLSLIVGAVFTAINEDYQSTAYRRSAHPANNPFDFLASMGPLFIIGGLIKFLLAGGLWAGRPWARTTAMVFAAIGLLGIPVGTVISILILYYLTRPPVEAFFGKAPPASTPASVPTPAAQVAYTPPPTAAPALVLCPGCRATIPGDAVFCGKCGMDLRPKAPAAPPPAPAGPRYCVSCGASVSSNTRFCPTCGGRVA